MAPRRFPSPAQLVRPCSLLTFALSRRTLSFPACCRPSSNSLKYTREQLADKLAENGYDRQACLEILAEMGDDIKKTTVRLTKQFGAPGMSSSLNPQSVHLNAV
jgi:hypothetical protein